MLVNKELIAKKLDFLNDQIHKIENMNFDEGIFVENVDIHDLVVFRLQQAVETCIDIATHIIAGLDVSQQETAKDAFKFLGEKKIITNELAAKMGKAADFRNRVKDYKKDLKDLRQFGAEILKFIESFAM